MNLTALGKVNLRLSTLHSARGVVGQKKKKGSGICSGKKGNWNVSLRSVPASLFGYLVANGSLSYLLCTLYLFGDKFL